MIINRMSRENRVLRESDKLYNQKRFSVDDKTFFRNYAYSFRRLLAGGHRGKFCNRLFSKNKKHLPFSRDSVR